MIPESAIAPLRQHIRQLQIIVLALAMGVIVFAGVAIGQNFGKPHFLAAMLEPLNLVLLAFGLVMLPLGIVLPAIIIRSSSPPAAAAAQHPPEVQKVLLVFARLQMATIIGSAMFEGGAFANLVGYMLTAEVLHLMLAGVLLLGILARFPLAGPTIERIERELRRINEEEGLKPATRG